MERFLSFRFDDGLKRGAIRSSTLLSPWRATYFIVNSWVDGHPPRWPELRGCDFGDLEFWKGMSAQGHDIQSHGYSHANFREISREEGIEEINRSAKFIEQIHSREKVFCYPFNALSDLDLAAAGYSAGGFETVSSDEPIRFNVPGVQDVFHLNSWAVRERHFQRVVETLDRDVPIGAWVILAFHSLDDEGHEPWSSKAFRDLVVAIDRLQYRVETVLNVARSWTNF